MPDNANELMEKLTALCKRRGFIFPSSEIYGGIGGFWDYGPLGVELKRNIKDAWWNDVVRRRDDMVGVDCSIIMNPKVWEASGHIGGFSDPMVDCKECKRRFRADQLYFVRLLKEGGEALYEGVIQGSVDTSEQVFAEVSARVNSDTRRRIDQANKQGRLTIEGPTSLAATLGSARCPECGGELTEPRAFNLMFKTHVGALEDSSAVAYLRPETAQGIFCNYKNVLDTQRIKVPFGIAQVGKSFRNEINPRNFTFRSREFEQMEIEFFCRPAEADTWYEYWRNERYQWYIRHGLRSSRLRLRDHQKDELAHYARACADVEYEFPFGISELEGIANRTDYDLTQHQKFSGKDLTYFDDEAWEADKDKFTPDKFGGDAKAAKEAADAAKKGLPYRFI
ncbi:MAG: glycine--tRNA ligase, partial [Planctomycetota bacterium]